MDRPGRSVVIVGYARTPIGSFLGTLSRLAAPQLGAVAIRAALQRTGLPPEDVQEVIMGQVIQAGTGQAPARQAARLAGLPVRVECLTVNKVCGSGLKAIMLAAQAIRLGDADVVVAGGMESMSRAPYLLQRARTGYRLGHGEIHDALILDGLWDAHYQMHMGNCAEHCARQLNIGRAAQDEYAAESYRRALRAIERGDFVREIVPVEVPDEKGNVQVVTEDEEPRRVRFEKIPTLPPVFDPAGTITAANASKINDGAAAVVVTAEEVARDRGLRPIGRVVDFCTAARDPIEFPRAPVDAIRKLFHRTGLSKDDVDLYEINEAFASVALGVIQELDLDPGRVNVHGGAIALGHPIGASGARLVCTLLNALTTYQKRFGVVSLCLGGGEAVTLLVERLEG
ncbi:MAG: thiolase family protein [Acidobacteria bacterium]|nr:thiolase family protein [Acidobacteriota bacterium]MDW7985137.1 thiolase family protein [Acidobacteriota bacterium]